MEIIIDRLKELESTDAEHSKKKVRGRIKTMENKITVNSPLTLVIQKK